MHLSLSVCVFVKIICADVLQVHSIAFILQQEKNPDYLICGVLNVMLHEADYSTPASFVQLIKNILLFIICDHHIWMISH